MTTINQTFATLSHPRNFLSLVLISAWLVGSLALSTRDYYVVKYGCSSVVLPWMEPFAATPAAMLVSLMLAIVWLVAVQRCQKQRWPMIWLGVALVPFALWLSRTLNFTQGGPWFIEAAWLAGCTGLSFGSMWQVPLSRPSQARPLAIARTATLVLAAAVLFCLVWWTYQAWIYYDSFLLGFNDFGHFTQRIANTLGGRGLLIESPVLPAFWDHFNPGLLLLIPAWLAYPDASQTFVWQALALSGSGGLVFFIGRQLGHSTTTASLFGMAWLVQPSLGQMNLAYTYGWHPITWAIPLLLATIWCLLSGRRVVAAICVLLALSMEEGVFVIVCLTALTCALWSFWLSWRKSGAAVDDAAKCFSLAQALPTWCWACVALISGVGFVLVYKFSGLAEFQTGRFVSLGASLPEVILSPVLRPLQFWGSFIKWDRWYLVLLLWLPCGLPAMIKGWPCLLPSIPPLALLMVWNHDPAHSIAFQYPSILLPLFWLATMSGARVAEPTTLAKGITFPDGVDSRSALSHAVTALATGVILSMFVGQLPHSARTLFDVDGQTYGVADDLRRRYDAADGLWLKQQILALRSSQATYLTTGRIAAHLVGAKDIETVGQFIERRDRLAALPDRAGNALAYYDWIILDRHESFQQTSQQTQAIEREALSTGYTTVEDRYDIAILKRKP